MSHCHSTKLKRHRKRSGFTQEELSFLLGRREHSAITHYEAGRRTPDLKTAFAYEVLFGERANELFGGLRAQARAEVEERARQLAQEISADTSARGTYKLGRLARLTTAV